MFGNLTPMVKNLLIVNVMVFIAGMVLNLNFPQILGLRYIFSEEFRPFQILTHIFVHGSGMHLFFNMFALFIFGPMLERMWGPSRFLTFFLVTGLGASVLYSVVNYYEIKQVEQAANEYLADPNPDDFDLFIHEHAEYAYSQLYDFITGYMNNPSSGEYVSQSEKLVNDVYTRKANTPMVGASGAVYGVLMAFGMLFPNLELFLLFIPFPVKAKYLVTFYGLSALYSGFARMPGDNVAHFAHLGGMLFAFILVKYWQKQRHNFY